MLSLRAYVSPVIPSTVASCLARTQVSGTARSLSEKLIREIMLGSSQIGKQLKNGKWKEFNKHAILIAEGWYANGLKNGLWKEYYDTGELMIEEYYKQGIQHGRFASYHPNGQLSSEGQYNNGRREGYFKVYDEEGRNVRTLLFIDDNQVEDLEVVEVKVAR
ncbi:toxin-antitoxin system YwqK family antitoxin [Chryseosolibacter indicus]|uniref:MORN repeat variant n=1 Tax=Chryseosolibacter indicus TaxID=2782351 RepID=A0ABS5VX24_9BACT|nr:hypothetical protein [Chryseosolibacter indicus]MBT1705973.1 hypothetical protein [Chryseosolibacter indicus]